MQKKSHWVDGFVALLLFALLSGAVQAEQALLWRVETEQGEVSHLFGTIHSEDPRVTSLPYEVEQAFDQAKTVVLEMKLSPEVQAKMAQAIMLPPAQHLSDLLPPKVYQGSVDALAERGYPEAVADRLRPWAVLLTLSMPQPKTGEFLDKVLHDRAQAAGKTVTGLETLQEQLAIFSRLSLDDQVLLLKQALQDYPELPKMMEQLTSAWLERDMGSLMALNQESMKEIPSPLRERFERSVIQDRNQRMAERAQPLLKQGGAFIAVGALHLAGEDGLVALLRDQGMKVTPVY